MKNTTNPQRQVLPAGLSLQLKVQYRKYCNRRKYSSGDSTLGGLFQKENPVTETNGPVLTRHIGEPDENRRLNISLATRALDLLLQKGKHFTVLEDKKDLFLQKANELKAMIARRSTPLSAKDLKDLDDAVNSYACEGWEVVVYAYRVTTDRINSASRKRNDGMFVTRSVLRRVLIKEKPSEADLDGLFKAICNYHASNPEIQESKREFSFRKLSEVAISPDALKQRFRGGLVVPTPRRAPDAPADDTHLSASRGPTGSTDHSSYDPAKIGDNPILELGRRLSEETSR